MRRKNLQNILNNESKYFVKNDIDKIYESLGISYIEKTETKAVEEKLQNESDKFTPNKIERIYAMIGVEPNAPREDVYAKDHIKEEGNDFVPNVKSGVFQGINKKEPKPSFFTKLFRPIPLGIITTTLVAAVATTTVLLSRNKKVIKIDDEPTESTTPTLSSSSAISMNVKSASESFNPSVFYAVKNDGYVDNNSIVSLNDESNDIISNFGVKRAIVSSYSIKDFTSTYLSTALNLGYIERQNPSKENVISINFTFDKNDKEYFDVAKKELENEIKEFIKANRVIAKYEVTISESEQNIEIDSELEILIRTIYEYVTRLFVTKDGKTVKVLCFSTNYEDWLEKYKDASKEEMQDYLEYLRFIDEMISDAEMKEMFLEDLQDCVEYQEAIDDIVSLYESLSIKYEELAKVFNEKFHQHKPDKLPPLEDDRWDWWDDYGHDHPHHRGTRPGPEGPEGGMELTIEDYKEFAASLRKVSFVINDENNRDEYEDVLMTIEYYADVLSEFFHVFNQEINFMFGEVIDHAKDGEYHHDRPHEDHYHDAPDDWDDWFDFWWDENFF